MKEPEEEFIVDEIEGDNGAMKSDLKISIAETDGEEFVEAMDSSF